MADAGILEGDVLIVDRSLKADSGKIVVGSVNGDLLVRRFQKTFNQAFLIPENRKYRPVEIGEFVRFDRFARGFDIHAEKFRGVQAEDFVLNRVGELRVMILLDQFIFDLQSTQPDDLALRTASPN